eukprot:jgi/Bigna1/88760/estExt_fgenesh1_pg.C_370129
MVQSAGERQEHDNQDISGVVSDQETQIGKGFQFLLLNNANISPALSGTMEVKTISDHIDKIAKEKTDAPAFLPNLNRQTSEQIVKKWAFTGHIMPEYKKFHKQIIVTDEWMIHTRLRRLMDDLGAHFSDDEEQKKKYSNKTYFEKCLKKLICKAFRCEEKDATRKTDPVSGSGVYSTLCSLFEKMKWRRPLLTLATELYSEHGGADSILASFGTVIYLARNCITAKRIAFNFILASAHRATMEAKTNGGDKEKAKGAAKGDAKKNGKDMTFEEAKEALYELIRLVERVPGEAKGETQVSLCCDTWASQGFLDCWDTTGDTKKLWELFRKPENFGKSFTGMRKELDKLKFSKYPRSGDFKIVGKCESPKFIANIAVNEDSKYDSLRKHVGENYIAKFAYFFTKELLLEEVLNQEAIPGYMGFPVVFQRIFEEYKKRKTEIEDEKVIEWLYDEYFIEIQIDRVWELFTYIGITKDFSQVRAPKDVPLGDDIKSWIKASDLDEKLAEVFDEQGYDDLEWMLTKAKEDDMMDMKKFCKLSDDDFEKMVDILDDWKLKFQEKKKSGKK